MAAYDEVSRHIDQAESGMRDAEARMSKLLSIKDELAGLVGRAEAAQGYVVVEWTAAGLADLRIDPRAMRLPSTDLAQEISEAVRAAVADLRERTRSALEAAGIAGGSTPTPEEVQAQLRNLREQMITASRASAAAIDEATRMRRGGR
jgi:DNA-binding protein YbaB